MKTIFLLHLSTIYLFIQIAFKRKQFSSWMLWGFRWEFQTEAIENLTFLLGMRCAVSQDACANHAATEDVPKPSLSFDSEWLSRLRISIQGSDATETILIMS